MLVVQEVARDHLVIGARIVLHIFEGAVLYNFIYLLWCQGLAQEQTDLLNHWPQILQADKAEFNEEVLSDSCKKLQLWSGHIYVLFFKKANQANLDHILICNIQKVNLIFVGVPRLDVLKPAIPINWNSNDVLTNAGKTVKLVLRLKTEGFTLSLHEFLKKLV